MEQLVTSYLEYGNKILSYLAIPTAIFLFIAAYNKKADIHSFVKKTWERTGLRMWNHMTGVRQLKREMIENSKRLMDSIDTMTVVVRDMSNAQAHFATMFNNKLEALATEQAKMSAELVTNGGSTTKDMVNKIAAIQWAELYEDKSAIIGYTDNKGNVTHINREFSRVTGRAADEFLGTNWVNVIHPKDRTRIIAEWTNAVKYDRDYEGEFSILDSNDREIQVESRAKKLSNSTGYYFKMIKLAP